MITSKYVSVVVVAAILLALLGSLYMVSAAGDAETAAPEYEKRLFNGETVTIDIEVAEEDWQSLLDNAQSKEYIAADLVIDGERFSTVGIRTKGNSSLTNSGGSDRYSLQLNPDKYVDGQSFYGLDSMCINNLLGDATYMKDYISYDIMEYLGVPAPLRNYAWVSVNGEAYGLFLLLERYDDSFLDRTYNATTGELYNVKMQMGERSAFADGDFEPQRRAQREAEQQETTGEGVDGGSGTEAAPEGAANMMPPGFENGEGMPPGMTLPDGLTSEDADLQGETGNATQRPQGGGFGGMGGFSSGGGSLVYVDDDADSYGSIFGNAVSSKVSDNDKQQVITAIEKLNVGEDLEQYWDVDEILRYLAAHTFVVNLDSYVSSMQQNYYLLEKNGVLSILPWDYNLAFGGFQSGDVSAVVNFPIDTPVSGVAMEDRPLVNQLLAVEEYKERYHAYLQDIVEGYVQSGLFAQAVERLDAQIGDLVGQDPTAYYSQEEYEASLPVFQELVMLRAESVAGQLEGSIPATTEGQSAQSDALVDASGITLSALGSMGGGRGGGAFGQDRGAAAATANTANTTAQAQEADAGEDTTESEQGALGQGLPQGEPPAAPPGQDATAGTDVPELPQGEPPEEGEWPPALPEEGWFGEGEGMPTPPEGRQPPGAMVDGQPESTTENSTGNVAIYIGLGVLLAGAFLLVVLWPKRKWAGKRRKG